MFALLLGSLLTFATPLPESVEADAHAALATLPGHSGFAFTELTEDGPVLLAGVRQDEKFAVGSTFKLFILGTLADDVNNDRRQLESIMLLEPKLNGPPASEMAQWPAGSPVTLHTLALKMIWISDNTATDHLHYLLGRERIEKMMHTMGDKHAEWNTPLLSTREMTELRDRKTGMLGREYQKLDDAAKRKFLAERLPAPGDYDALDFDTSAYDVAEWYATPLDMASAFAWLKSHTEADQPAHKLRDVLTVDKKLTYDAKIWPYVGFKGGSEDQILAGNWLLKNANGHWYTFHLYWNNPQGKADPQKLLEALNLIFHAIQAAVPAAAPS